MYSAVVVQEILARETRALKMMSAVTGHWKLTTTNPRSCQRTQCGPFYGHSAFEANWKDEKSQMS